MQTEEMAMGNEERSRCSAHEGMIKDMTEVKSEVRHMKESHERVADSVDKMSEKLNAMENKLILWGGALGIGGSVLMGVISNIDKIKAIIGG
jgi:2-phosphoglycerate kinase